MAKHLIPVNEVVLNYKRPHIDRIPILSFPSDSVKYLRSIIDENTLDLKEYCWVTLLNSQNGLLGISMVSAGTISSTEINMREIFQVALIANASKIVVIHNHPSGDLKPSSKDVDVTRKLMQLGKLLEIQLVDHLIISSEGITSIRKELKI